MIRAMNESIIKIMSTRLKKYRPCTIITGKRTEDIIFGIGYDSFSRTTELEHHIYKKYFWSIRNLYNKYAYRSSVMIL